MAVTGILIVVYIVKNKNKNKTKNKTKQNKNKNKTKQNKTKKKKNTFKNNLGEDYSSWWFILLLMSLSGFSNSVGGHFNVRD